MAVLEGVRNVDATEWNTLAGTRNPFVRHEFLSGLEVSGSVGAETGWQPRPIVIRAADSNRLLGAVPLYLKHHSYGEYVFDWAWAEAYERAGLAYYPKLVAAVPFTPATGPRLLVAADADRAAVAAGLLDAASKFMHECNASSLHWLYPEDTEVQMLEARGYLRRVGCQFHWSNPGYRDFDDFLSTFTAAKRKKIKRERRCVREAGIDIDILAGDAISSAHWDAFYAFYHDTVRTHGAIAYLTRAFFHGLGASMPGAVMLVCARRDREYVAAALYLRGADTLYGRYWGGHPGIPSLHFETCYYAAIEYCIATGIAHFEAGAQGEHKLARGFAPTPTYSAHVLRHPRFNRAVADFLARERPGVARYISELNEHSPFRRESESRETP